jgi:hypothetical protein
MFAQRSTSLPGLVAAPNISSIEAFFIAIATSLPHHAVGHMSQIF